MILEPLMVGIITSAPTGMNAEASTLQSQEKELIVGELKENDHMWFVVAF